MDINNMDKESLKELRGKLIEYQKAQERAQAYQQQQQIEEYQKMINGESDYYQEDVSMGTGKVLSRSRGMTRSHVHVVEDNGEWEGQDNGSEEDMGMEM